MGKRFRNTPARTNAAVVVALLVLAVFSLGACRSGPAFSHFTVCNQTTVSIVFTVARSSGYGD